MNYNGVSTSSRGLSFNYADPEEGNYMLDLGLENGRADTTIGIKDLDGTLLGEDKIGWYTSLIFIGSLKSPKVLHF